MALVHCELMALLTRWGGKERKLERFVRACADRSHRAAGLFPGDFGGQARASAASAWACARAGPTDNSCARRAASAHLVDATFGGGGYARAILRAGAGLMFGIGKIRERLIHGRALANAIPGSPYSKAFADGDLVAGQRRPASTASFLISSVLLVQLDDQGAFVVRGGGSPRPCPAAARPPPKSSMAPATDTLGMLCGATAARARRIAEAM